MRKALVILSPGFPENENDSTCVPPQQTFVRTLQRLYPERQIIILSFIYPFLSGEYQWHEVKVIAFGKPGAGRLHRKMTYVKIWRVLQRLRGEYELQGLLAFWFGPCAWLGTRFAKRYGLPFYTWILGQDARPGNKFVPKIKPAPENLIALSDATAAEFEKNYAVRPSWIVPPGVDPALFAAAPAEKDIDVLAVGSFIPLKQFDVFIDVVRQLKTQFPSIRAVLCGDGPESRELKSRAAQLGLTGSELTFTGRLSHPEVLKTMQRARILLHPSSYEGFGVVCLEALYAGASVISFVRPMNNPVEGWFSVSGTTEMSNTAAALLSRPVSPPVSRMPFTLEKSARSIHQFFEVSSSFAARNDSYFGNAFPSGTEEGNNAVTTS